MADITFSIGDRDYISKLNALAESSTNAEQYKGDIEVLVQEAERLLTEQQSIAAVPVNWRVSSLNTRLAPAEKLIADSTGGSSVNVYFPGSLKEGESVTVKALGDNVLIRPEGYTLRFPLGNLTSPDVLSLTNGDLVQFVATAPSTLELV